MRRAAEEIPALFVRPTRDDWVRASDGGLPVTVVPIPVRSWGYVWWARDAEIPSGISVRTARIGQWTTWRDAVWSRWRLRRFAPFLIGYALALAALLVLVPPPVVFIGLFAWLLVGFLGPFALAAGSPKPQQSFPTSQDGSGQQPLAPLSIHEAHYPDVVDLALALDVLSRVSIFPIRQFLTPETIRSAMEKAVRSPQHARDLREAAEALLASATEATATHFVSQFKRRAG